MNTRDHSNPPMSRGDGPNRKATSAEIEIPSSQTHGTRTLRLPVAIEDLENGTRLEIENAGIVWHVHCLWGRLREQSNSAHTDQAPSSEWMLLRAVRPHAPGGAIQGLALNPPEAQGSPLQCGGQDGENLKLRAALRRARLLAATADTTGVNAQHQGKPNPGGHAERHEN